MLACFILCILSIIMLLRPFYTTAGLTILSRILGFVRDILIAAWLGAGLLTDAFFVAFKLPNFMRRLFAEGAFHAAFVPLFASRLTEDGKEKAQDFAADALSWLFAVLLLLTLLAEFFMPWLIPVLAPGFGDDPERLALTTTLTRITFPYLLCISLVSLMAGMLNSLNHFAAAAAAPILLNLCLIGSLLFLTPLLPHAAYALAWGVALAGVVQCLWLLWHVRRAGFTLRLRLPARTPETRQLFRRLGPGAIGAGVAQINLLIDTMLATLVPQGVSYLYYADRLNQLPIGVIGVAMGTALLPALSRYHAQKEEEAAAQTLNQAIFTSLFFTLPAAVGLAIAASPILTALFEHGAFTAADTAQTARALMAYALGLPAFILVKVLVPGFFARGDTRTPVKIAAICLIVNLGLNLLLLPVLQHAGLALATSLAGWLNVTLLALGLRRRNIFRPDRMLRLRSLKLLAATTGMALSLWIAHPLLSPLDKWPELAATLAIGGASYLLLCMFLRLGTAGQILRMVKNSSSAEKLS